MADKKWKPPSFAIPVKVGTGNIDLYSQPKVKNRDGSISTVDTIGVNFDGKEYVLPRVTSDGRHLSSEEAIEEYKKTGKHLGYFDTVEEANTFAEQLHKDYESGKYDNRSVDKSWKPPSFATPVEEEPSIFSKIGEKISEFAAEHPRLREIGERFLTGTSPEFEELKKKHGVTRILGTPESEGTLLPKLPQAESYAGGFASSLYEDFIRPLSSPSGIVGMSDPWGIAGGGKRALHSAIDEMAEPLTQKLLTAGPRFTASEIGVADTSIGQTHPPIRRSTEIPYRALDSFSTIEPTMRSTLAKSDKAVARVTQLEDELSNAPINRIKDLMPQFAKTSSGKLVIGADPEALAPILASGYKGDMPMIVTKELLQNSVDATASLGPKAKINIEVVDEGFETRYAKQIEKKKAEGKELDAYETKVLENQAKKTDKMDNYISVNDNGTGLTKDQIFTIFSDLGRSGKRDEATAVGGFGIAKASFLTGGSKVEFKTIVKEADGKLYEHSFSATPQDLINQKKGVDVATKLAPEGSTTGTTIKTHFAESNGFGKAEEFVKTLVRTSKVDRQISLNRVEGARKQLTRPERLSDLGKPVNLSNEAADVELYIPPSAKYADRVGVQVKILNNGMYQNTVHYGGYETLPNVPDEVIVNIKSKVKEGDPNYPFEMQREGIKGVVHDALGKYIDENVVRPGIAAKSRYIKELYNNMGKFSVADKTGKVKALSYYDTGKKFTEEEIAHITGDPTMMQLGSAIDETIREAINIVDFPLNLRLDKTGFLFDQDANSLTHGIWIPNPGTEKAAILINPLGTITGLKGEIINPDSAASAIHHTILHEINHFYVGGHNEAFTSKLGEVYEKYGSRGLNTELAAKQRIKDALTRGGSDYVPEVYDILQQYKDSRGRSTTFDDPLYRTGIKSTNPERNRKGKVSKGAGSGGERITPTANAVNKLFNSLNEARGLRVEQEQINRIERAKRFAAFEGVKATGEEGARKSLGKLKGEFEKVNTEALELNQSEVDSLFTAVKQANITAGEKARGYVSLYKLLQGGPVPQRSELAVLDAVFGGGFSDRIIELHGGLGAVGLKVAKTANTMKAMMSSTDLSAPFRQGIGLAHRKEWRDAFKEMHSFLVNPEAFDASMAELKRRPTYLLGRESKLFIADTKSLSHGEEAFLNSYVHNIPVARTVVGATERAYTGFLNKLRQDTFDAMIKQAKSLGHEAFTVVQKETEDGIKNVIVPSKSSEAIAKYINHATGRGSLGKLEKVAPELNTLLWSPRLISSRIQMLSNPSIYMDMPKGMRLEAVKSLLNLGAMYVTMAGLAAAGTGVVGSNLLSADFGKLRMGNKVLDPYGGFQQPIVAAARFITASNEVGKQERFTTLGRFSENKLSPAASLVYDLMRAQKFEGHSKYDLLNPNTWPGQYTNRFGDTTSVSKEVASRFAPMFLQDLAESIQGDSSLAEIIGLGIPALYGASKQEYPERTRASQRRLRKPRL